MAGLLAAARESDVQDGSVVRALEVGGLPAIAAAATITPGWDSSIPVMPGTPSVMMFVTVLDPAWLARLSEQYGVPALTASHGPLPGHESMPLLDSPSIHLNWHPPQPGRDLLRQTLPLFAGGVLLMLGVLVLLLRNALASARQIDAQLQALRASQAELQGSERRFRDMAETSSDWLWGDGCAGPADLSLRPLLAGRRAPPRRLAGAAAGRPVAARGGDSRCSPGWSARTDGALPKPTAPHATPCCAASTTVPACSASAASRRGRSGEGQGFRGTATNLTDEWQAQARVRHLSLHDTLTGLPNRRRLHQFLATLLESDGPAQPLALLCLDLDRFKPVNDALGHALGTGCCREVARRLQALLGPQDIAARLGGDEFVLVLAGAQDPDAIGRRCAAVVAALCEPFAFDGQIVCIGTSIGVVQAPLHARTAQELLRKGDIALYDAKAAGRNTWRCYTDALDAQAAARLRMEQDLRVALRTGQMRLHYQPCYAVDGGALRSLEALVRWQHPVRGMLQPEEFLPLARETGLIRPLGEWVLRTACLDAAGWPRGVRVSVNLSAGQFGSAGPQAADLPSVVAAALRDSGLPARRLELEINEGILLTHGDEALQALAALKQQGVWLTLADFASGYSSLACLRHLLPDGIKIGRGFVAQLPERAQDRAIVQAVGALAHALGVSVRAEGVETRSQLDCLMRQPCDEVQGFHFSDALPPEQLDRLWGRRCGFRARRWRRRLTGARHAALQRPTAFSSSALFIFERPAMFFLRASS